MNSFELSQITLPELLNMLSSIILFVDRSFIFRLNSLLPDKSSPYAIKE